MIYPLLVGRESSLKAIEEAMILDKLIFLSAQKNVSQEEPEETDLYRIGVVARILQILKLPNGLMKVLVEGIVRGRIKRFLSVVDHIQARIEIIDEQQAYTPSIKAKIRRVGGMFKKYVRLNRNIPDEILLSIENVDHPQRFGDFLAAHIQSSVETKQRPSMAIWEVECLSLFPSRQDIERLIITKDVVLKKAEPIYTYKVVEKSA